MNEEQKRSDRLGGGKRAEDALRESEELLSATQRLSKIGGWVWDIEEQSMSWTEETYRIHDFVPGELVPGSPEHIARSVACYDPEDRSVILATFQRCAEQGEPYDLEFPFTSATGRRLWVRTIARAVWDKARIVKVFGNIMDITDRKQAEEALRESEAQYRLLADNVHDQVWLMDLNLKPTYISPSVEKLRGYAFEEIAQLPLDKQLTAASFQSAMEFFSIELPKALADPTYFAHPLELEFYRKDGSTLWVENMFSLIWDENGKPLSLLGVGRDITERKRAEESLRESEERYRTLFETMTEGVILIAPDGQILHANPAAERILRLKRSEIEGHPYNSPGWELLRPDGTPMPPEEMAAIFTIGGIRPLKDVEMGFKRSDGFISWINLNAAPLLDQAGELVGVVVAFRDITEREQLKRETTKKITGQLTAGIAHQIRNPLFIISLSVQSIEKQLPAKDPQRRLTQAILDKVRKLDVITADLVHLGKYHRLQIANSSLRKRLELALILVRAPAKTQQVKVVRRYAPHLPRAWIDIEAMDEVFANLLTNALEAMPEGGLLTVETSLDEERKELLARIQDNGCGIPKAVQENIFI
ncbi:MAG: PAS domain S-box protein, partial [bacterium]